MFFSCGGIYIEKQSLKKKNQIISNQYSLRMQIPKSYKKRAFYTSSYTQRRASLTIEAAMVLPIFIFAVLFIIYGMKMIELQTKIQYALDVTAMEMGSYAPSAEKGSEHVTAQYISAIAYSKTGAKVMFLNTLNKCNGDLELIKNKSNGFSFSQSNILKNDSEIELVVKYSINFPKLLGINLSVPCVQNAFTRGFTGKKLKASRSDTMVYITTGQTVYHTNPQCTHLKLSIKKIKDTEVNKKKYSMCSLCKKEKELGFVYITSQGERYHKTLSCKSLKRTIYRITLAEVGNRRVCKRCAT